MSRQICIFSFEIKKSSDNLIDRLCYCYGNVYCNIYKSGAMNLKRSPFLINIFVMLINKLRSKYDLHIVSDMKSIVELNIYLHLNGFDSIVDVIDINSCSAIWKLSDNCDETPTEYKLIYKKYAQNIFQKENMTTLNFSREGIKKLDKHSINILLQSMSYAIDFPSDATNIITEFCQIPSLFLDRQKNKYH